MESITAWLGLLTSSGFVRQKRRNTDSIYVPSLFNKRLHRLPTFSSNEPGTVKGTVQQKLIGVLSGINRKHTVRNGHGNFDLNGKFTKNRLCNCVQNMEKEVP
jgi:hypothetical protein